jgi:hypothetical protein
MSKHVTEQDLVAAIKAGLAIDARDELLDAFVQMAGIYIERGLTQEGADILAFVMLCTDIPEDIAEAAEDLWEDLATWICPRVLLDAEDFAKKAFLDNVVSYVLAGA